MNLKCTKHGKRVFVWRAKDGASVAHRSGDFLCDSETVAMGPHTLTPQAVIDHDAATVHMAAKRGSK